MDTSKMTATDSLLTTEEAAKFLNVSTAYLARKRVDGDGPTYVKLGRAVRYSESSLRQFIKARTRTSTSFE
jgi:excisionase family DNA binding protein